MIWEECIKTSRSLIQVIFPHFPEKITKELERLVADFELVTSRTRSRGTAHWISTFDPLYGV